MTNNPNNKYIDATPKTYFLHSLRNAHLPNGVRTALGEFIDNSLGEGSGNAQQVTLVYNNDNIAIIDNGKGIDDLSLMLTLGDSQNRASSTDIGNFGYGSKVGALYLGWFIEIHTVNKVGEYRRAKVDWKTQEREGTWHVPYDGKILPHTKAPKDIREGGTMVIVRDRHEDRKWRWSSLAADLAHTYRPALESGREIRLVHAGDKNKATHLSDYLEKDILINEFTFNGEVKGKPFTVTAGERVSGASGKPGAHIAFGHRVIETTKSFPDTPLPSAFYAMIKLGPEWKKSLGSNKTTVAIDRQELLEAVRGLTISIIESIKTKRQEVRLDLINAALSKEIIATLQEGGREVMAGMRYWEPVLWKQPGNKDPSQDQGKKKDSGLIISLDDLNGKAVWDAEAAGKKVMITLNNQLEFIKAAYDNPLDPSAVWTMIASAVADLVDDNPEKVSFLALTDEDKDYIAQHKGTERRQIILTRILNKAPVTKEPTAKEIEEAQQEKENG